METFKWSCRHIQRDAVNCLIEVQATSGGLLGELASEAILDWFEHLAEEEVQSPSIGVIGDRIDLSDERPSCSLNDLEAE